ncbi:MAG: hypothetical protein J6X02_04260 [Bacilli bacterium]|nr:hypothetical protein [Bacilli bacterium]
MQKFRYFTRMDDIVTSIDVDIILKEDSCLLLVNKGGFLTPKIVYARREQGLVIEKEQPIELKYIPDLLYEYSYLPVYYIGFSKSNMRKFKKDVNNLYQRHEEAKDSEEGMYNDFLRDLKRNREKWLLRQANVDKVRNSFENNIKNNNLSFIDKKEENQVVDINDIIDKALSNSVGSETTPSTIDEMDFIPKKKMKD